MVINRKELSRQVSRQTGVELKTAEKCVVALLDALTDALAAHNTVRPDVRAALEAEIADLRPGEPLVLSRCAAAVSGLAGVADVVITAPAANVQPTDLQWCRLGTLTLEAL